jgi:hypothetical protein
MEQYFYTLALTSCCIYGYLKGGMPERLVSIIFLISSIASGIFTINHSTYISIEWGLFFIDITLAIFLVCISLSADRYWPMWLSALQIVSALMHPAFGMSEHKSPFAYVIATVILSYPMLAILMIGTYRYQLRKINFL